MVISGIFLCCEQDNGLGFVLMGQGQWLNLQNLRVQQITEIMIDNFLIIYYDN